MEPKYDHLVAILADLIEAASLAGHSIAPATLDALVRDAAQPAFADDILAALIPALKARGAAHEAHAEELERYARARN